jgi:uncharacterized surface protein with fasciclin (FAS1) repeats
VPRCSSECDVFSQAKKKGNQITLTDEKVGVATVTTADMRQSNGVIHVIDKVLLAKS